MRDGPEAAPAAGYPFTLDLRIDYRLDGPGLAVTLTATNAGPDSLPFGAGFHPSLTAGSERIDASRLSMPAAAPAERDFRVAAPIGDRVIDDCYTGLQRDAGASRGSTSRGRPGW